MNQLNCARGCLISTEEIDVAAKKWSNSLLGKLILKDDIAFDKIQHDMNIIWRRHRWVEIHMMSKNLFVFKLKTADDMNVVLEKEPWIIFEHLMVLINYNN